MNTTPVATVPAITVAGRVFTDLANLKILGVDTNSAKYSTLRLDKASYQVPAGKVFRILAVKHTVQIAAASSTVLGYGDADVGLYTPGAPANAVLLPQTSAGTPVVAVYEMAVNITIPALKWPFYLSSGTSFSTVQVYGYEE